MQASFMGQIDVWMGRMVALPNDTEESFNQKKSYLTGIFALFGIVVLMTCLTWQLDLHILTNYGLALLAFFGLQFLAFIKLKSGLKWFVLVSNSYNILLAFVAMVKLGGITHSGGLIFVGLTCVVYSMIYPSAHVLGWSFFLYLASLLLTALLQPKLTPAPEMVEWKNLLLFVLNSFWLSANILILVFYVYRKQAEIAKLKAQRLLDADELKTRMFANIAHEFRTPLTLIEGMASLIDDTQQQIKERTAIIQQNTNKLLRLVNQMLNLAKLEAGNMPLNQVRADIVPSIKLVFNAFEGMAAHRQVKMHFLPESQQITMDFDPEKMEELLSNLLSNALKYTPTGGDVYLTLHHSPTLLTIHVKDTGIGIPPDKIGYIFDRFYRVENEQHYEEGSGIGLTLVREYVQMMGGNIAVTSTPGIGSDFCVQLPITTNAPIIDKPLFGIKPPFIGENGLGTTFIENRNKDELPHLLVIEDNYELGEYLSIVLGEKYHITMAKDGEEGIQKAVDLVPDLILSDVMMPKKDGYEVCASLKKDFRTCHIPIVLLSARADATSRIIGLERGADAYLAKPFNKRELKVCLRNLMVQREKLRIKFTSLKADTATPHTDGLDEIFMRNANSILEKNFADESFGIEELYRALNISRVQLHRKLMALTGLSASHFIRSFRLEKAKGLLLATTKSVSEVAYDTGFSDANYFSRVYAQKFGHPPSEARRGATKTGEKQH